MRLLSVLPMLLLRNLKREKEMKKIMFNDKYGLTQAVLEGKKTQTRRIVSESLIDDYDNWLDDVMCIAVPAGTTYEKIEDFLIKRTRYRVGEVVAVAQSYKDIFSAFSQHPKPQLNIGVKNPTDTAGWTNKVFVASNLMPHQIRITGVRLQRLQNISDEDCLAEGIIKNATRYCFKQKVKQTTGDVLTFSVNFDTPREAYAALIDKISGKGTWNSNPYVWAYTFGLVK